MLTLRPIGVIRTPFVERASAPRQSYVAKDVPGVIELEPARHFEDALVDMESWEFLWVIYWFHLNADWRPKVLPPRSDVKRGVFATRSPHRPCPIGLSAVRLERVEGLSLHVRGVDMVDGSPVLDLKPYVAAADAIPDAGRGWLEAKDPVQPFEVIWSPLAEAQLAWLADEGKGEALREAVERTLRVGPRPHAYRRIRDVGDGAFRLAVKEWRVRFRVDGRVVQLERVETGYRARELATGSADAMIDLHRRFVAQFGDKESQKT